MGSIQKTIVRATLIPTAFIALLGLTARIYFNFESSIENAKNVMVLQGEDLADRIDGQMREATIPSPLSSYRFC